MSLQPHPDSPRPALRLVAEAERAERGGLVLRFAVTGQVSDLVLPEPAAPGPADGLWRHTCFEAFVRAGAEAGYIELNFAPSGRWAAYRFSDYRAGMAPLEGLAPPEIEARLDSGRYELAAAVGLEPALGLLAEGPWRIGLSAVIETRDGGKSYWAAAHGPGEPDFHHRDCFALELPPPRQRV